MSDIKLGAYLDDSYKQKMIDQLNTESAIGKLMREERERKEKLIRESLHPFHSWLVERTKWKWLLRHYYVVNSVRGEKIRLYQVYRKGKLLKEAEFDLGPTITFKRFGQ